MAIFQNEATHSWGLSRQLRILYCSGSRRVCVAGRWQFYLFHSIAVEPLNFCSSPWRFSKKLQARLDTRVIGEAPNGNLLPHRVPTHMRDELFEHHLKCNAVQWIQRTPSSHIIQAGKGLPVGGYNGSDDYLEMSVLLAA